MIRALALLWAMLAAGPAFATCGQITHKGADYTVCSVVAGSDLRLWHRDAGGALLGSFTGVERALAPDERLIFAMNAGMYHPDRRPVGLYVENYRQTAPLTDGGGYGNFGLIPNGVFCITPTRLRVIETTAFRTAPPDCRYATQSGPMVVIGGALHPRLLPESRSRHIRNGVGTDAGGERAVFAISEQPVNFHDFATLFRDRLGLTDALYFDGKVSRLFAPEEGRHDTGFPLGPMIGLVGGGGD